MDEDVEPGVLEAWKEHRRKALENMSIKIQDGLLSTQSQTLRLKDIQRVEVESKPDFFGIFHTHRLTAHCASGRVVLYERVTTGGGIFGSSAPWEAQYENLRWGKEAIEVALTAT